MIDLLSITKNKLTSTASKVSTSCVMQEDEANRRSDKHANHAPAVEAFAPVAFKSFDIDAWHIKREVKS